MISGRGGASRPSSLWGGKPKSARHPTTPRRGQAPPLHSVVSAIPQVTYCLLTDCSTRLYSIGSRRSLRVGHALWRETQAVRTLIAEQGLGTTTGHNAGRDHPTRRATAVAG